MKRTLTILSLAIASLFLLSAEDCQNDKSDTIQHDQQEKMILEATAQTGMPAIKNFRERKLLKDILELRDQNGLVTYTYLYNEMAGTFVFFGDTIGYGIPYATQYTNPSKITYRSNAGVGVIPQADPNGLFSPASAEGTWVLMKNPNGDDVKPVYVEPRVIVSPFKLNLDALGHIIPARASTKTE